MVRVITQETYDEIVKENMEEFEMSPEEAMKEAVAQFQAQGVDLSNIIKDLVLSTGDDHLVTTTLHKLKELYGQDEYNDELVLQELDTLKAECNKDLAHRVKAAKDGAYNLLIDLLEVRQKKYNQEESKKDSKFIVNVLNTLIALMDTQPDLLESRGVDLIKSILDTVQNEDILIATLKWTAVCCLRHEMNRQRIFVKIADNLKNILKRKNNVKLKAAALQVVRRLTLDDDIRVEFGKAHEHARELGIKLLTPLTESLNNMKDDQRVAEVLDLLQTITPLLVRHELCAMVADAGICTALFTILANYYENVAIIQMAVKLVTALAGNDDVKRLLVQAGIVPVIVSVTTRHSSNATAAALSLKCIAALSLREPAHSEQLLDTGAAEAVVECMQKHPDDASVQKNACWAIRNLVARYREQNSKFHELGTEGLLNEAYNKFNKDFGFDIKSALRDLECDVKLDEQWTGKGIQMDNDER